MSMTFLVTGGAGFIGSAVVRELIEHTPHRVINVDKLTYAGNPESLARVDNDERYEFRLADICDASAMTRILREYRPDVVMHLAAESHVDRSIDGPSAFIETNIVGTYQLMESVRGYWQTLAELDASRARRFRFHHVSTDEVYGDLEPEEPAVSETHAYAPSSPYAAS